MTMADDRAASEVIGSVLIFGFLVITFAIYQGVVVPQQNRAVEFEHNLDVQEAIQDLRNALRQSATGGTEESVSITLGATYPQRVLAMNPGVSAGSLRTESVGAIRIENVSAGDDETDQYFSADSLGPFDSQVLVYRPVYSHYTEAPDSTYENTLAYNQFPGGVNLSITDQAVIDGRKITLVALGGNLSEAEQGTVTVDTQAVSPATTTVSVTASGGPINITVPTRLPAADWEGLLADELDPTDTDGERFVTRVTQSGPGRVSIILEEGVSYELRLAKVGVGDATPASSAKYIVDVEGDGTSVIENGTQELVVEVRDRFNNPVSNVTVSASVATSANASDPTEGIAPASSTTDAAGRATFTYSAPEQVDGAKEADITASFDGDGTANESVIFDVRVLDADSSTTGDETGTDDINPSETGEVVLINGTEQSNNPPVVRLHFNNTAGATRTIDTVRISFYYPDQTGDPAESATVGSGPTFAIGGSFEDGISEPLSDGIVPLDVEFEPDGVDPSGDFFIMSVEFEETTGTKTYFVSVE